VLFAGRASREAERAAERAGAAHPDALSAHEDADVPPPGVPRPGGLRARY
jgi:hypothetical protein